MIANKYDEMYNRVKHPNISDFTYYWMYKRGDCVLNKVKFEDVEYFLMENSNWSLNKMSASNLISYAQDQGYIVEKFEDRDLFKVAKEQSRSKTDEIEEQFKKELFILWEVSANPKRDLLFAKAWELGHSNGFGEVEHWFEELVELIR